MCRRESRRRRLEAALAVVLGLVSRSGGVDWQSVRSLNQHGLTALSRRVVEHPPHRFETAVICCLGDRDPRAELHDARRDRPVLVLDRPAGRGCVEPGVAE